MRLTTLALLLAGLTLLAFHLGRRRALRVAGGPGALRRLHSLPSYHGYYVALWTAGPALLAALAWLLASDLLVTGRILAALPVEFRGLTEAETGLLLNEVRNLAGGQFTGSARADGLAGTVALYQELQQRSRWLLSVAALSLAGLGLAWAWTRITPERRVRNSVERAMKAGLIAASSVAVFTTLGILLSIVFEAMRFFGQVPVTEFLFGLNWSPQMAIRADQVGSSGAFGAVPLFAGTLLISAIAMAVAVPIGLMIAIYLSEYARPALRRSIKPLLEVLAGIPTVVYGYFAALTVAPMLRGFGEALGLSVASESALGAGLVMGIMIIPFVSSLSDDVINAVPQSLRDGSLALGATPSETIRRVVLPAALPGIVGAVLLAVSRAIGETMIVVMAAGLAANLTANPLESVTTVTVQIVTLLVGDQEFDSPKTLAAFALGLVLFLVTLVLNVLALTVVRRYREQYD